ncbi:MAG: ABC transporter ATP-binding protein, partial [Acetobacteraceae bacterium]
MAEITLQQLRKTYSSVRGDVQALLPLDLTIADGEFITILGPSGCGKTTLLSVIVGAVPPSGGRILVNGVDVTHADPRDRDMAMVFQNYALYPSKTVRGNLEFPLRMHGVSSADRTPRVNEMAKLLGLSALLDNYPRQLSGGQQQRVALGRALIRQPKLFLMDEPLSNLDAKLRLQMRTEIRRLHREVPVTTAYVTHDQSEAMALSDRVVVMNQGAVVQLDTPNTIYSRPANLFVAGFVGAPAMNLFPVSLIACGDGLVCRCDGGLAIVQLRPGRRLHAAAGVLGIRPKHVEW